MTDRSAKRVSREIAPGETAQTLEDRRLIEEELPELLDRNRRARDAREEPTLSGELRRAVHGSAVPFTEIARLAGISPNSLSEFLTGERTLRSDVLDRLAQALGYELRPATHD